LFSAHTHNARRPFTAPGAAFSAIFLQGLFRQTGQGENSYRHRFLPVVPKSVPSSLVAGRIAQGGRKFRSRVICRRARMKRPEMHQALKVRKQTQLRPAYWAGRNRKDLAGNRSSLVFLDADVLDLDIGRLMRRIRGPYRTEAQPGACRHLPLDSGQMTNWVLLGRDGGRSGGEDERD